MNSKTDRLSLIEARALHIISSLIPLKSHTLAITRTRMYSNTAVANVQSLASTSTEMGLVGSSSRPPPRLTRLARTPAPSPNRALGGL